MKRNLILAMAVVALVVPAVAVQAGTLENLERERAILVETLLSPSLTVVEREEKLAVARHRLVDLERMVLRDKSLVGRAGPVVRRAFDNYDLTFIVHASVEKERTLVDHWLEQVGVSTHTLMTARVGRR